ncbi:MAG: gluconokinase, GntK/IdnK-type [Phenylobacterium sp.]|uniref:gluconokinase n=1 Tax=Phenylobacterium sp. TaxID=1871053 RepID=UPI00273547BF|nr:gluconokinase, GntK/IdnK-type [Phenylobacterium sp.]MDP3748215.1 gluconokinase, GntK/IdnK-type [Phenylobacterium sp.]
MTGRTLIVLMGVAGSGKSTIGRAAAARLGLPFVEADDFHPQANREKMAAGQPLTDADRRPWIEALTATLARSDGPMIVLACSALTLSVRAWLEAGFNGAVRYILLSGEPELIGARLAGRRGHFAGKSLLASQFTALTPPDDAWLVDVARPVETVVDEVCARIVEFAPH